MEERIHKFLDEHDADIGRMRQWGGHGGSLRWGGTAYYNFLQQVAGPTNPQFSSQLLAQAKSYGAPRAWTALMQCTFDPNSEWSGSAGKVWTIEFRLYLGVGQANVIMSKYASGNPVDGFTFAGDASAQPPFANLTANWEYFPGDEVNAIVVISGNQTGSPAAFTGSVTAMLAPYSPLRKGEHHHHG